MDVNNVLDGTAQLNVSHAGGEFQQIMEAELHQQSSPASVAKELFQGTYKVQVVDVFSTYTADAELAEGDLGIAAALVHQGLTPCAPFSPTLAIATRLLELYRNCHLRCPHLAIQPFVRSICDLHGIPFRPYLSQQFSIAYDLYLSIHEEVDIALQRDSPNWHLRNACPACSYKLKDEDELIFKMLITMDGNDSLKHILRRTPVDDPAEGGPEPEGPQVGDSRELPDSRKVGGDYIVSRERVDRWAKATLEEMLPMPEDIGEESPCVGRWTNMINELTARMWGIFDETGVFLALCRHGFVLVLADMVQSGELAKYPLAVVEVLLEVFGTGIGGGYDIGCKFATTLNRSELGAQARALDYKALVGSFHGHAHNRLCQLSFLATYVNGMGLEDLEGCECFFSKSNALASSLRYASVFHRQQKIVEFMKHMDNFETYPNLSKFLVNNYRQALDILKGESALKKSMADHGITNMAVFGEWLVEEWEYLKGLATEPIRETQEMEYYQKLVNLGASEVKLNAARDVWQNLTPQNPTLSTSVAFLETKRRHALENWDKDLVVVQELEVKLSVQVRWIPDHPEWKAAALLVGKCRYQQCLDELEGLIVSRMFELTKMNMSQTGYKLRKHITMALRARSQAIRKSLDRYNTAASTITPPRPHLSWNDVVEYAFLADFDLLRDSRQDVHDRPWTRPAVRVMIDQHFKLHHAREEIQHLNIEIHRVVTYIQDENSFLQVKEVEVRKINPALAHQVAKYRLERGCFNEQHMHRFKKLASLPEFTGSIKPGFSMDLYRAMEVPIDVDEPPGDDWHCNNDSGGDDDWNNSDEGEDDQEDEDISAMVSALLSLTMDRPGVQ
ncbi:hypothetical protein BU17DRAFT_48296 [Hysterangium stoloniferum]|nr:hypothetical protein BU17DRAFT_48296 [Hysterangium stoloniferum]